MSNIKTINADIILEASFQKLTNGAKSLYFLLLVSANDYGFIEDIYRFTMTNGYTNNDLNGLAEYGYVIIFPKGCALIAHWFVHMGTQIICDAAHDEEYKLVTISGRIFKPVGEKVKVRKTTAEFVPPTLEEVKAYAKERKSCVSPVEFFTFFNKPNEDGKRWVDSNGKPVQNWKRKFCTWERFREMKGAANGRSNHVNSEDGTKGDSSGVSRRFNIAPTNKRTT